MHKAGSIKTFDVEAVNLSPLSQDLNRPLGVTKMPTASQAFSPSQVTNLQLQNLTDFFYHLI